MNVRRKIKRERLSIWVYCLTTFCKNESTRKSFQMRKVEYRELKQINVSIKYFMNVSLCHWYSAEHRTMSDSLLRDKTFRFYFMIF